MLTGLPLELAEIVALAGATGWHSGPRHPRAEGRGKPDAPGLEEAPQALRAELAAQAGLLEPAERHERERRGGAVGAEAPPPHAPGGPRPAGRIPRPSP